MQGRVATSEDAGPCDNEAGFEAEGHLLEGAGEGRGGEGVGGVVVAGAGVAGEERTSAHGSSGARGVHQVESGDEVEDEAARRRR